MTKHAPAGSVSADRGKRLTALPPVQPSHDHVPLADSRCREHLCAHPAEQQPPAGHIDSPAARAIQRRPHQLGPDLTSRIGQRAVRPPSRRRYALPAGQQPWPKTKPVRPRPGEPAAQTRRGRVLDQPAVVRCSLPGFLEGDRLDLVRTAGERFCLRDDEGADVGRQGSRAPAGTRSIGSSSGGGFRSVTVIAAAGAARPRQPAGTRPVSRRRARRSPSRVGH